MAAALSHDQLLPRPPGGLVPGAVLALLAHAALLAALTAMVQWRATPPEAVSAELWSAVPQLAAPAPPPPAPPPPPPAPEPRPAPPEKAAPPAPDPQIAIAQAKAEREKLEREKAERGKAEKAERERAERDKAEKAAARKAAEAAERKREQDRQAAEEKKLAEQRQKNLERMMGQAGTANSGATSGTAAQSSGPSATYPGRLVAAIKPNIVFTDTVAGNPAAEVEVRTGPSGTVIARRLLKSSGHKEWDEAVLRAIDRTGTLPRDTDGRVPPVIVIAFRPNE